MSDMARLLAKFESGEFLRPSPDVPNIVDLARALAGLAGVEGIMPTAGAAWLAARIGPADHLVFILADGLGLNLVEALPSDTFLASHLAGELRTVFPSATAVALTSLATAEWPGQHGVTGWWTHLPELRGPGALLPFVDRAGGRSLARLGITVADAFPLPAVLGGVGRDTLALFPAHMTDSISSAYFSGGKARRGYHTLAEAVDAIVERVRAAARPTYTYLYTPQVDTLAHRYGTGHSQVQAALADLDRQLARLAAGLDGRGRVVLSADHGLLDTPVTARFQMRPSRELTAALRFPPSGDARVLYLHLHDGAEEQVRRTFQDRYGERFLLIAVAEAEQLGLFGPDPLTPELRERFGDLIALSRGVEVIEYVAGGGVGRVRTLNAHHAGLTPAEMRVPLVVA